MWTFMLRWHASRLDHSNSTRAQRNARALADSKDPRAVPILLKALLAGEVKQISDEYHPQVYVPEICEALARIGNADVVKGLVEVLRSKKITKWHREVAAAILGRILRKIQSRDAVDALIAALDDKDLVVSEAAADALTGNHDPVVTAAFARHFLCPCSNGVHDTIRRHFATTGVSDPVILRAIEGLLTHQEYYARENAAYVLKACPAWAPATPVMRAHFHIALQQWESAAKVGPSASEALLKKLLTYIEFNRDSISLDHKRFKHLANALAQIEDPRTGAQLTNIHSILVARRSRHHHDAVTALQPAICRCVASGTGKGESPPSASELAPIGSLYLSGQVAPVSGHFEYMQNVGGAFVWQVHPGIALAAGERLPPIGAYGQGTCDQAAVWRLVDTSS